MYQIGICDDNPRTRELIREAVMKSCLPCHISEYDDGIALINSGQKNDILFLDIDMPQMDGLETASAIRRTDKKVKIIYVTGYADYVHQSFSVHPFAFLIKPVSAADIQKQLRESVKYESGAHEKERLRFNTDSGVEIFEVDDIYYLEYTNRKIRMVTKKGEYFFKGRITELVQKLEPHGFACPHKSFTVNLFYIKSIRGYNIHLLNGDSIPLSQKRSAQFRNVLGSFQAKYI